MEGGRWEAESIRGGVLGVRAPSFFVRGRGGDLIETSKRVKRVRQNKQIFGS